MRNPFDNEERRTFRDAMARFVRNEIEPFADDWDEAGAFPWAVHEKACALGLFGFDIDEVYGGLGFDDAFMRAASAEEFGRGGAGGVAASIASRSILVGPLNLLAAEELKARALPEILSGRAGGALGITEPSGGSDVANLQTRAHRDGDEYVLDGQKIWTTRGHEANWLFTLARTDSDAPKHRGISFLLVDMKSPGVTVQPLINMAWQHGFNETFFEDVHVPVGNRVGDENRGWYVSVTLMDFERSRIRQAVGALRQLRDLIDYLGTTEGSARSRTSEHDSLRHEIADRAIEVEVAFNLAFRVVSMQAKGVVPNYEASMLQMSIFETNQRMAGTEAKLFGLHTNVWAGEHAPRDGATARGYVNAVSSTIAGGTVEIQRNIIATRGLGLPRG